MWPVPPATKLPLLMHAGIGPEHERIAVRMHAGAGRELPPVTGAWQPGDPSGRRQFLVTANDRPFALDGGGALRGTLDVLASTGTMRDHLDRLVDFGDFTRIVRLDEFDEIQARYGSG